MRLFVGVTDGDWFRHLAAIPAIDEVNFWQPSGSSRFCALAPGEVFLFKLHSPRNVIVGGGVFAQMSLLPVNLAWEAWIPVPAAWSANIVLKVPPTTLSLRAAAGLGGGEAISHMRGRLLRRRCAAPRNDSDFHGPG